MVTLANERRDPNRWSNGKPRAIPADYEKEFRADEKERMGRVAQHIAEAEQRLRARLTDKTFADSVLMQWVKDNLRDEARRVAAERDAAA